MVCLTFLCVYYVGIYYSLGDPDCSGSIHTAEYNSPVTSSITDPIATVDEQADELGGFLPPPAAPAPAVAEDSYGTYCEQITSTSPTDADTDMDQSSKQILGGKRNRADNDYRSSPSAYKKQSVDYTAVATTVTFPFKETDHTVEVTPEPSVPWRALHHTCIRNHMKGDVSHMMFKQKLTENMPDEWVWMVKSTSSPLEALLYAKASSFAEYTDLSTLKSRLRRLARDIPARTAVRDRIEASLLLAKRGSFATKSERDEYLDDLPELSLQIETLLYLNAVDLREYSDMSTLEARLASCMAKSERKVSEPIYVDLTLDDVGDGLPAPIPASAHASEPIAVTTSSSSSLSSAVAIEPPRSSHTGNSTTDSNKQMNALKQHQQRLLLLQHASKCTVTHGETCKATPHCSTFKTLWQHVLSCKDDRCTTKHCVSSRHVLSHYSKCKQTDCQVCGPVRSAVRAESKKNTGSTNFAATGAGVTRSV